MAEPKNKKKKENTTKDLEEQKKPAETPIKATEAAATAKPKSFGARLKHFASTTMGKVTFSILGVLLVIGLLLGIPYTRYAILGTFIKKDASIKIIDSATQKPVTEATVTVGSQQATSDNDGNVTFKSLSVGPHKLTVQKNFYTDTSTTLDIWILSAPQPSQIQLQATGRQVPVKVLNKLNKQPVENALITAAESTATTNASGEATIVLPADQSQVEGNVELEGYNNLPATISVTDQLADTNTFSVTPSGKIYFLSKRSGIINVMKTNLDGTQQAVVLEGTGTEQEGDTQLVATRDWHYMALKSRRDGTKQAKLYLINSSNDNLVAIDAQDADYQIVGWYNEYFIYIVNGTKLKSYNANTGTTVTLDEVQKLGNTNTYNYANESFDSVQILENDIVYAKNWLYSCKISVNYPSYRCIEYSEHINGKSNTITSVRPNGTNSHIVRETAITPGQYPDIYSKAHKTKEVWFRQFVPGSNKNEYFVYNNGTLAATTDVNDALFGKPEPTYFSSPGSLYSFWHESRDGKNTLLVGDSAGDNGQVIATLTEYTPLGWYSDDYMLASKNGSELYIMPRQNTEGNISKVTDFHKPQYSWPGQGYSYGWFYRSGNCCGGY